MTSGAVETALLRTTIAPNTPAMAKASAATAVVKCGLDDEL